MMCVVCHHLKSRKTKNDAERQAKLHTADAK